MILFALLVAISTLAIFYLADGTTDALYYKFTTPKQTSLIIGTSRAAQGIQPQVLDSVLERDDIFNYAFTIPSSPYGDIYLDSIKRKLDTSSNQGLFILEVNPWTFSKIEHPITNEPIISETNNFLDKLTIVNQRPNLQYLIGSYKEKYINILRNKNRKGDYQTFYVENNGWLRVTIESDMISTTVRTNNKLKTYSERIENFDGPSTYRLQSLKKTIEFLNRFGLVYIVRVPIIDKMLNIENELYPNFNEDMMKISKDHNIPYLNFTLHNEQYDYTDGNHLDIKSGNMFSLDLANSIKSYQIK